jgi:hypothetical protein
MSQLRNPYANGDEVDGHEHDDRFHGPHGANRMKTDPDDAVRSTNNDAVMARM